MDNDGLSLMAKMVEPMIIKGALDMVLIVLAIAVSTLLISLVKMVIKEAVPC